MKKLVLLSLVLSATVALGQWSPPGGSGTGSGISSLVQDTAPKLGGDLDLNGHDIPAKQNSLTLGTGWLTLLGLDSANVLTTDSSVEGSQIASPIDVAALPAGTIQATLSTDGTLPDNSDTVIPSELAVKTYVDQKVDPTSNATLTNKRLIPRVLSLSSSATPTINSDGYDAVTINNLGTAITSMTTNLTGTPSNFERMRFRIRDDGTGRAITWGSKFASGPATLPTTTTASTSLYAEMVYNSDVSKWICVQAGNGSSDATPTPTPTPIPGGTSPGTTNLIAWYDFANVNDATGTYNLSPSTTAPTYNAGPPSYGIATDGTPGAYWTQSTLDDHFGNAQGDWSMVIRFKGYTSVVNGDVVVIGNGGRWKVIWQTSGIQVFGGHSAGVITTTTNAALDTWFTVIISHDDADSQTSVSINGSTYQTATVSSTYANGNYGFGDTTTTNSNNFQIDFAGFFHQQLTQDEADWIYNSGGTRVYSDL